MTAPDALPRAVEPFFGFAALLRRHGFAVAPDQTRTFIEAVGILGPRRMADIHAAALATLAPSPDRREEFDALFRLFFLGQSLTAPATGEADDEEELQALDERDGAIEPPDADETREVGAEAASLEALALRGFADDEDDRALADLARRGPAALPRRPSYRRRPSHAGDRWNMRRILRDAVRRDGEVLTLPSMARGRRQRRLLVLLDISGSMKQQTDGVLRFAHVLAQAAQQIEVFTMGTRLTRISRALRHRRRDQALAVVSTLVADWDGGTRLGDALAAFLAVPRFSSFARGALVLVLSDGLERGDPSVMVQAVERLSRLAWRLVWLTPLAGDPAYVPQTEGLRSVLPYLDRLGDGSRTERLCAEILDVARSVA